MSASSSTISTSCAMSGDPHSLLLDLAERSARKDKCHFRSATVVVAEDEAPAMVLRDLLDDRQPEAGALGPRRHIGLGQALAPLDRQPLAVVRHFEPRLARVQRQRQPD